MKQFSITFLILILFSCQESLKEGYCVGKTYIPTHYEDVTKSKHAGKFMQSYTVREKKEAVFNVYISKIDRVRMISVDSINYPKFIEGKFYKLKN